MEVTLEYPGVKVWDGLLDDKFIVEVDKESDEYDWRLNNIAGNFTYPYGHTGSHLIWGCTLYRKEANGYIENRCPLNIYDLYLHITKNILKQSFELTTIQLNAQSLGQNGSPHTDDNSDYTLMVLLNSKWEKKWGGSFQFMETPDASSKIVKSIDYIPGRIVFFKGEIPHRGLAPIEPYIVRKTLVFRLNKI